MSTGRVVVLVIGCVATFTGTVLLILGAAASWGYVEQHDEGYIALPTAQIATPSPAAISESLELFVSSDLVVLDGAATVTVGASAFDPTQEIFVGIGPTADVIDFLRGVAHTTITDVPLFTDHLQHDDTTGRNSSTLPARETWWSASASGTGSPELSWEVENGAWTIVVMNADGSAAVDAIVDTHLFVRSLGPLAVSALVASAFFSAAGIGLIVVGRRGRGRKPGAGPLGRADATRGGAR